MAGPGCSEDGRQAIAGWLWRRSRQSSGAGGQLDHRQFVAVGLTMAPAAAAARKAGGLGVAPAAALQDRRRGSGGARAASGNDGAGEVRLSTVTSAQLVSWWLRRRRVQRKMQRCGAVGQFDQPQLSPVGLAMAQAGAGRFIHMAEVMDQRAALTGRGSQYALGDGAVGARAARERRRGARDHQEAGEIVRYQDSSGGGGPGRRKGRRRR